MPAGLPAYSSEMGDLRTRRRIEIACLAVVLLLAAFLRLWRLEDNGYGTAYYAAGVRSLLQGGALFFYNAFDPAGFVSLDKPPLAFWIQAAFASVLGFSGWTIHLPQAVAGVGSVAVLYRLVRKPFGAAASLIAALLLAIAPVMVAIDRSNNTDPWLVFFLLLAAWAALRGRGLALVIAMALLGVAFNVKMLAALVCGPALLLGWLVASGGLDWKRRLAWMSGAGATLAVVALSWSIAFDLTPKDSRPYAGSTTGNSMLELVVVHNGLERFVRNRPDRPIQAPVQQVASPQRFELYDSVPVGPLRLAQPTLASQFAWFLPLAVLGLVLVRRRDRTWSSLVLWGTWALSYGIVYSAAGGIFHIYYLSTLAPPFAALAGIGAVQLWRRGPRWLAAGLAAVALWQAYVLAAGALGWETAWMAAPIAALLAAAATLWRDKRPPAWLGGVALLVLPLAWALSPIFAAGNLTLPSASLPRWLGVNDGRGPILSRNWGALSEDRKLVEFLMANRGQARFLAATPSALVAAPLIIRTGQPVMAMGGFSGRDPILTVEALAERARRGEVRYVLLGGRAREASELVRWVWANGKPVDETEWRSVTPDPRRPIALYELKVAD
jgi:4-amino-4-deoxy-L-arabinose transferase-like glycosyltransferase